MARLRKPLLRSALARLLGRIILWFLAGAVTLGGGVRYWYYHRSQPRPERRALFEGITYVRDVRRRPRPMVIHVVTVNLNAPGIGFVVTPGDPKAKRPLHARKTSQFLSEFHAQLAINGDSFYPWHSNALWDYYPHAGDPVSVQGFAASRGQVYSDPPNPRPWLTLYLAQDNRLRFGKPQGAIYNALSGGDLLISGGKVAVPAGMKPELNPRTAIGLERDARHLIFVLVDGRQPRYSEGCYLTELAGILQQYGAWDAINLDGGGSTTLVAEQNGKPDVLNCPIDNKIPGRERPVANHLGIFARALPRTNR